MLRPLRSLIRLAGRASLLAPILAVIGIALPRTASAGPLPVLAPGQAATASDVDPPGHRAIVAVVKAPDADRGCQEIVTRIVAELMADGVSVVALTCPAADPACVAGSGARVSAIVLVQVRDNVRAVEVHASEAASAGRMVPANAIVSTGRVQRVADADPGSAPAALAVRTVEMLRAMLVDSGDGATASARTVDAPGATVLRATPSAPKSKPEQPDDDTVDALPARELVAIGPHNVTMSVGVAMFTGAGGLNNAYGPAFSIGRRTSDHVMLSLALAGPAFGRDQSNFAGRVSVRHELAAFQADLIGLFLHRFVLRVGMAAGVSHIAIEGHPVNEGFPVVPTPGATPQASGRNVGAFSGLLSWSGGVVANIRPDLGVYLDGRLYVLTPTPQVLLRGLEVGTAGNPQVALTAGLEFRL